MELLVVATIALIVFGPDKLPGIARQVGRYAAELRRMASDVRDEFESSVTFDDEDDSSPDEIVVPEEEEEKEEDEPAKDKPDDPDEVER